MGSRERREREKVETRQRILEAAREMFVEQGYVATTMRAIAQRVEYTPTALYHHFRNKEALLQELCNADFRTLAHELQRIGRLPDPVERLARLGDAYVQFAVDFPMQYRFMFMLERPQTTPEGTANDDPAENAYAFLRETCVECIAQGSFRPEYDDPDELAQMLWSILHGIVSLQLAKQHDAWIEFRDLRTTAAHIRQVMLRGLMIPPHTDR